MSYGQEFSQYFSSQYTLQMIQAYMYIIHEDKYFTDLPTPSPELVTIFFLFFPQLIVCAAMYKLTPQYIVSYDQVKVITFLLTYITSCM